MTNPGVINTTITLKSAHASLVARIFSTGRAIDPATMSIWEKTKFLMVWWWVGLATFPRTAVQALTLLLSRKMPWIFRPEPRRDTMPRRADPTEVLVERVFRKYLQSLVETCEEPLIVKYSPAGLVHGQDATMTSAAVQFADGKSETLEFKVLTPSFYSRFLHYSQGIVETFKLENESATITISDIDLLSKLKPSTPLAQLLNPFEHPRFWAIQNLRNAPLPIEDLANSAPSSPTTEAERK